MASHHTEEKILSVHHWSDRLFSLTTTRDANFRFENGQFVMLGLMVEGKPLMRAYSMVSANYDETLEFYSIKVPDGPLTSRLQHVQVGDTIPGYGRVLSVEQQGTNWVVRTEHGTIR